MGERVLIRIELQLLYEPVAVDVEVLAVRKKLSHHAVQLQTVNGSFGVKGLGIGDLQCLFNVEGTGLSVRAKPSVVVNAVGYVGALLYLRNEYALADGMESTGLDEENVPLLDRNAAELLHEGVVLDSLAEFLLAELLIEAVDELRVGSGVNDVPHLGLAVVVFVFVGVFIVGVNLHGQVVLGVDELYQHGEAVSALKARAHSLGVFIYEVAELHSVELAAHDVTLTVGVTAQLPALCEAVAAFLAEKLSELCSAPYIVLNGCF